MDMNLSITNLALLLLLSVCAETQPVIFDIRNYGASPNLDITQAWRNAWKEACASTCATTILIPAGTYKLTQVKFTGPCNAPIEVQVDGIILAPENPNELDGNAQWVKFSYVNFFTLSGSGTFDGQDITSKDSKHFHVNVLGCNNVTFTNFTITAPSTSPNTDGIHIGRSSDINITNSFIGTGDDCISLGGGSRHINVLNVTCGPGHGISVGSLGKFKYEDSVEGFFVRNCTLKNTDNGLRIKTWLGAPGNTTVSFLHYEDIIMINVSNPIIIEQDYCPYNQCSKETPSKIKISNVTFKSIKGTSATPDGVALICSSGVPCEDVELNQIDLTFNGTRTATKYANVIVGKPPGCVA
ncbi:polygalacturonase-like [Senna tora]|uniref:Polygalacturonase-like n=1 Tax=Senna tora TaxID=362788 RepID=A0A834W2I8_9FABA|nr:polygalacturonase-like [Senna tora]